ncbi:MAG: hypothetical protein AABZ84_01450 [Pseudomonadota bacterium]
MSHVARTVISSLPALPGDDAIIYLFMPRLFEDETAGRSASEIKRQRKSAKAAPLDKEFAARGVIRERRFDWEKLIERKHVGGALSVVTSRSYNAASAANALIIQ